MTDVVRLTAADCRAAGALLAARHASERQLFPLLPAAYEDPALAADLVEHTLSFGDGVAAADERGQLVGFLISFEAAPDPTSPMSRYAPERASTHLVHGHAVADGADAGRVYGALFGELAGPRSGAGVIDHVVHLPIGDPAVEASWVSLGFGRANLVAVRDLAPVDVPVASGVEVRRATPDELDIVDRLVDEEIVFHAASPMFRPYRRAATSDAVRTELSAALASDDHAFLLALPQREGRRRHLRRSRPRVAAVRARWRRLHRRHSGPARRTRCWHRRRARQRRDPLGGGTATSQRACTSRPPTRHRRHSGPASASRPSWPTCAGASKSGSSPIAREFSADER